MLKLKIFVAKILANNITGAIISYVFRNRIPFHGVTIDVSDPIITDETKALLFWRIYEKAEVTFVKKYLASDENVIELGSSIGVMGSIISQIQTTGKYVSVEANPTLINANQKNVELNRKAEYNLVNRALDYFNNTVSFSINKSNLDGKVHRSGANGSTVLVKTITLDELCTTYGLLNFTLISDIEGAEIALLLNDQKALDKCSKMIIELHDTVYNEKKYPVKDMVQMIIDYNFSLLNQHGAVFVFEKNNAHK
jgi:FkbM family methyltransferase